MSTSTRHTRRRLVLLTAASAIVVVVVAIALSGGSSPSRLHATAARPAARAGTSTHRSQGAGLVARSLPSLAAPVQDAAVASLDTRTTLLLAGLTASDTSSADVVVLHDGRSVAHAALPAALHDAAAVGLRGVGYLFGGGNLGSSATILAVDRAGATRPAGALPRPASDVSAATIGDTAYVVGGYTGSAPLDTIVAWRPGRPARIVAHLPHPLRYAAVAAAAGRLVIAGGTIGQQASRDVLAFDPATRRVTRLGTLPQPTTHAAAAPLGSRVYVVGGRGATPDTPTDRVTAIDPAAGRVLQAARLPSPRSDAAVAPTGGGILVAGGRGRGATLDSVLLLSPRSRPR